MPRRRADDATVANLLRLHMRVERREIAALGVLAAHSGIWACEAVGLSGRCRRVLTSSRAACFPRSGCRRLRRRSSRMGDVARELSAGVIDGGAGEYREASRRLWLQPLRDLFREFERQLSPVMRQHHVAGDKVFVDFSASGCDVDPAPGCARRPRSSSVCSAPPASPMPRRPSRKRCPTGSARMCACSASSLACRACSSGQSKNGVPKAWFFDPGMMAAHYGVGVLPARLRKPRDKAKVEAGVRFAQSYILGRLRHQTFFSLAECNAAIASCSIA